MIVLSGRRKILQEKKNLCSNIFNSFYSKIFLKLGQLIDSFPFQATLTTDR